VRSAAEYGYKSGVIQGASGILRVTVAPGTATVEYVRAYPANNERDGRKTGSVTHRYTLTPAGVMDQAGRTPEGINGPPKNSP
jgi:hypothetical protein